MGEGRGEGEGRRMKRERGRKGVGGGIRIRGEIREKQREIYREGEFRRKLNLDSSFTVVVNIITCTLYSVCITCKFSRKRKLQPFVNRHSPTHCTQTHTSVCTTPPNNTITREHDVYSTCKINMTLQCTCT